MPKLVYIYGDDGKLLDTLMDALKSYGYSLEYTDLADDPELQTVTADIALLCKPAELRTRLTAGRLTVDLDSMSVCDDTGKMLHFTPTEFALLTYLMKNSGRAVPRDELLPQIWGFENDSSTRVADDTVKRLRKKLIGTGVEIKTIWGFGFRLNTAGQAAE